VADDLARQMAGAHVRTGLGDNPVEVDGSQPTNEQLVQRVVELAEELGREVATPKEGLAIFDNAA
jgi:uncharacterized protein (DUF849 family)